MRTYFYCVEDSYGQRTGHYKIVQLIVLMKVTLN
jgi:hypothetical protein